jgi:HEAT repeat protein
MPTTPLTRRRWIKYGLWAVAILGAAYYVRHHVETLGDRAAIAQKLRKLADNVRKNPNDRKSLDKMISVLNGDWSFARTYACGALCELGPLAKPALPDLICALNCGDGFVEREAARALGEVGVGMSEPVEPLRRRLRVEGGDVAHFAATSLGKIGEPAHVAIPDLEHAANSTDPNMAYPAKMALKKLRKKLPPDDAQQK